MIQIGENVTAHNIKPMPGNAIAPPLVLGETYPVKQIHICGCGKDHIDVGLPSKYNYVSCYTCKEELPNGDTIHWCHPSRFVQ